MFTPWIRIQWTFLGSWIRIRIKIRNTASNTLSQKWSDSRHINQACHGWSGCNRLCPAFIHKNLAQKPEMYRSVVSAPTVTNSDVMQRIGLFLGQCTLCTRVNNFFLNFIKLAKHFSIMNTVFLLVLYWWQIIFFGKTSILANWIQFTNFQFTVCG